MIQIKDLRDHIDLEMQNKHFATFSRRAGFVGNGIYKIDNLHSTDTRELFLMYVAQQEGIEFDN